MVHNYTRKSDRGSVPPETLRAAVKLVQEGMSVRGAADTKGIQRMTLVRFMKSTTRNEDMQDSSMVGYTKCSAVKKVMTVTQEKELAEHIKLLDSKFYGLCKAKSLKLAYDYAN